MMSIPRWLVIVAIVVTTVCALFGCLRRRTPRATGAPRPGGDPEHATAGGGTGG
ncbi:MAG: hypothetical protein HYZ53_16475 [Planctomycetes bacterium]|nr:hypothetical protein [Planctomycetota bacterium]